MKCLKVGAYFYTNCLKLWIYRFSNFECEFYNYGITTLNVTSHKYRHTSEENELLSECSLQISNENEHSPKSSRYTSEEHEHSPKSSHLTSGENEHLSKSSRQISGESEHSP